MATINRLMRLFSWSHSSSLASQKASNQWGVARVDRELRSHSFKKEKPEARNIQWIFLGCPGVGKGTYASRLSKLMGIPHIATGDLVREELTQSGPSASELESIVNRGKLVPDDIIVNLLARRLEKSALKGETGFILDGFPRTINQAGILEQVTDIDLVINLKLREEALLQKCLGRRICSQCGGNYNVAVVNVEEQGGQPAIYMAPLLPPPSCASKLITRADDTEEVVKERLRVYSIQQNLGDDELGNEGILIGDGGLTVGTIECYQQMDRSLGFHYLSGTMWAGVASRKAATDVLFRYELEQLMNRLGKVSEMLDINSRICGQHWTQALGLGRGRQGPL
ncbi:hypothetical protein KI387_022766 [Taxus chinensis]|uniref:adenylate kinase n=1 Tax=Taxus chinensis TaxID=29808 RepID=A0AA38G123_TAXCH|nr:hypothetical protein KI387_022766 [Taxus chinensis]